jgi:DNA (cytosine-5)-methyltransferase 1
VVTAVDLFCGAGGLSRGMDRAGFRVLLAVDSDKAAIETYREALGHPTERVDVTAGVNLPAADVVVGGPPCQGFSSAGSRREGDRRNTLVGWYAQTIATMRPRAFMFENVEGFLTGEGGRWVTDLLEPILEAGYRVHLRKVNAADYGVPQHRKRVIAIGGLGWTPTFPDPTHSAFGAPGARLTARNLPPTPTVCDAIGDLPHPADTLPGTPEDHYSRPLSSLDAARCQLLAPGQTMRDLPQELWHDSFGRRAFRRVMDGTPSDRRGGAPAGLRRLHGGQPSKAITSAAVREFIHPTEDRPLTLREAARLQTFPDEFTFRGNSSDRAQLIGNAVPPLLAEIFARQLFVDLMRGPAESDCGSLVSFVPTLSEGMSPALRRTVAKINARFGSSSIDTEDQMPLCL